MRASKIVGVLACGLAAATPWSAGTLAQAYPTKTIRMVVPFAPGGVNDLLARLVADHLEKTLGQRVLVETRPGAGGNIGAEIVAKAPPDGHTLCLIQSGNVAINPFLYKDMTFDALNDLVPVAPVSTSPQLVSVYTKLPVSSLRELIALAKREPGKLNHASPGNGTSPHLAAELFAHMAGIQLVHVPYRGVAPALVDLAAGQVQLTFLGPAAIDGQLKAGTIRPLAVARSTRLKTLPDVPTADEAGLPGYEFSTWFGVVASKGTPADIVAVLNRHINAMLDDPDVQKRLAGIGMEPLKESTAQFAQRIKTDYDKFGAIVQRAKVTLE